MESKQDIQPTIDNQVQTIPQANPSKHTKRTFTIIVVLLLFIVIVLFFLVSTQLRSKSSKISSYVLSPSPTFTTVSKVKSNYETSQTKIASSLDVPSLYPYAQWEEISTENGIYEAMYSIRDFDFEHISFKKGHAFKTKTPAEYGSVEKYYSQVLENENWLVEGGTISYLRFNFFKLYNLIAGMSCAGIEGYIGYKDGFVRIITVGHELNPCLSLDSPDATAEPSGKKYYADYEIFISDPVPIEKIADYIKSNSGLPAQK